MAESHAHNEDHQLHELQTLNVGDMLGEITR